MTGIPNGSRASADVGGQKWQGVGVPSLLQQGTCSKAQPLARVVLCCVQGARVEVRVDIYKVLKESKASDRQTLTAFNEQESSARPKEVQGTSRCQPLQRKHITREHDRKKPRRERDGPQLEWEAQEAAADLTAPPFPSLEWNSILKEDPEQNCCFPRFCAKLN